MSERVVGRSGLLRLSSLFLVVGLAIAGSGCDGDSGDTPRTESRSVAPDETPVAGGTLSFGVLGEPATLDPYDPLASDLTDVLVRPLYPSLFRFDENAEPEPYLASSIEEMAGGARVELKGARWSNGRPVTATDVSRSIARADDRSGFALITRVRVEGRSSLFLRGDVDDWPQTLARRAYVMPGGRPRPRLGAGPFSLRSSEPGLRVVLRNNDDWFGGDVFLDRIVVYFVQDLGSLMSLLSRGELDAAFLPSALNLDDRLASKDLSYSGELGRSSIVLRSSPALTAPARRALVASVDRSLLEQSFIRDAGRSTATLVPEPGKGGAVGSKLPPGSPRFLAGSTITLAAPLGDELLEQMQRAMQIGLDRHGVITELVGVAPRDLYGRWRYEGPADAALVRRESWPGEWEPRRALHGALLAPLFHVKTYVAWGEGVSPIELNGTGDGPLWAAETLWKTGSDDE